MPTAVISDIHGNAEALRSVLNDIDARGVGRIICLG
ncbi:MAG: metallophosphatase family protein, partial [Phycisphaerales bacterium]